MSKKNTVAVITLGCSKNTVDSERLMNQIKLNDLRLVDDPSKADTIILNTCGFIEAAKEESIDAILQSLQLKSEGKVRKVIVAGCLSERYHKDLSSEMPEVDAFFGTEQYEGIINELGGTLRYELLGERVLSAPSHTAYLKISEGCDNPCSFCAIPLIRGKHHSKSIDELVKEAEFLAANGTKELIIIGQDTTAYGMDLYGKRSIAELLDRLSNVRGIEWLRLMYAYPSQFPDDLIDVMANNPKVLKYIDIPLQHISDNCLRSMRRGITKRRTLELLQTLRKRIPGLVIRTTFIVGYPAEMQADFEELKAFIGEFQFDKLGVFDFSQEEQTPSFILGDPVRREEKNRRKAVLLEVQQEISLQINQKIIGKKFKVLIDRIEGDYYIGRSYRDAPEVDGEVLILKTFGKLPIGTFTEVTVTDCDEFDLYAEPVKQ
jgi:ribosomal protein S12 methylthiotransferase